MSWETTAQAFEGDGKTAPKPIRICITPSVAGLTQAKEQGADATINNGTFFVFNGDTIVPTESLSPEGFKAIRYGKLYLKSKLKQAHDLGQDIDLPAHYVSTKHMYWPVKANGLTPLPWWNNNFPDSFDGYVGYETWDTVVAIDPTGKQEGETVEVTYLHGIFNNDKTPMKPKIEKAQRSQSRSLLSLQGDGGGLEDVLRCRQGNTERGKLLALQ
ncbi:hypothetical protein [Breoghania sp.]|uniref:hypothetical protein n=1 Tax=Breoghania sp. TaxID=2065378 RepID=UPI00261F9889|nr:hypothetical protein [Breoghania sp.]MDJ0930535.1 hypothetical protein [Breoghania sp.]